MLLHWFPGDVVATLVFPCYDYTHAFSNDDALANATSRSHPGLPYCYSSFYVDVYTDIYSYTLHSTHGDTYAILSTHPNGHNHSDRKSHHHTLTIPYKLTHTAHGNPQRECHPAALTDAKRYTANAYNPIINPIPSKL